MSHERFTYKSLDQIRQRADDLGIHIPFAESTAVLAKDARLGNKTLANRLGSAPMEGNDSLPDGSPSELTLRRYLRETEGMNAMLWFEAISIVPEARSSLHQLMLTPENLDNYKRMIDTIKETGMKANGFAPYLIMQANHSGRYSNPQGRPAPLIAQRNPIFEKLRPADDSCIVSDDYLMALEEKFGEASLLARQAGFDAVDIKSCHGYLLAELAGAYLRPGMYGGSYENRTRLLRNGIAAAKVHETDDFRVTARISIYDGFAWPYGFGVAPNGDDTPDYTEPIRLIQELHKDFGLEFVNLTMGNPYVNSHVTRPFNAGKYIPEEHPLVGISRMINGIGQIKKNVPDMFISASAPSFLRHYGDLFAAGAIEEGLCDNMLFGRMSLADPGYAKSILTTGRMEEKKTCLACGKCGDLIRAGKPTGCVLRDQEIYLPHYRDFEAQQKK